jgi:uncharacterized protein (DUF924 family)
VDGQAQGVLDFWFGAPLSTTFGTERRIWFKKDAAFDRLVAERFGMTIERALRGELDAWAESPASALARVILLDQFTRNAFRGQPRSFCGDAQALAGAIAMLGLGFDDSLPPFMQAFVYLPFEHAEDMSMQDESVRLFTRLAARAPQCASMLDYAQRHRHVIARFGRFPHRNAILGRSSTAEEMAYLSRPGSSF